MTFELLFPWAQSRVMSPHRCWGPSRRVWGPHSAQAWSPRGRQSVGARVGTQWSAMQAGQLWPHGQCLVQVRLTWPEARLRQHAKSSPSPFSSYAKTKVGLIRRFGGRRAPPWQPPPHVYHPVCRTRCFPTPPAGHSLHALQDLLLPGASGPWHPAQICQVLLNGSLDWLPHLCSLDIAGLGMAVCPCVGLVPWDGPQRKAGCLDGQLLLGLAPSLRPMF